MKLTLIPEWKRCFRMHSIRALALIAAVQSTLLAVPAERLAMPILSTHAITWGDLGFYVTLLGAALGALGRLVDQPTVQEPQ